LLDFGRLEAEFVVNRWPFEDIRATGSLRRQDMRKRVFTLVELMIVVIIVAILAASAVPIYRSVVGRAYEAEIVSSLATLRTAQRVYRAQYGEYADSKATLESENLLSEDDFEDMKYVDYVDLSIANASADAFDAQWNGSIDGYDYGTVTLDQEGTISRQ
jgi:prepilin-type N-terminal cleavage/methylation domain-containing protein